MPDKIFGVKGGPIEGVVIKKLTKIPDERGCIYHMIKKEDEDFNGFGEIYFSTIYPGVVKGWHIHKEMELNYAVISGDIKMVLYDDRPRSKTKGNLMEIFTGEENYLLIKVPPKVWNGFKGVGVKEAIVANCATLSHDSSEIERLDPLAKDIPYDWSLKNG
ncbi:MAG TPA: dTDP-4-dehydrorhamnose 3,5-epimerase family protein [Patescibacteria group bacterium]|nr:dTDP-4-dehydrorhamnose 3,5-epimerase family protein [Patescibacteria group bacterium]